MPTMMKGPGGNAGQAARGAPGGAGQPSNRTPLILGAVGCLVLLLVLACGGAAAYYFLVGRQTAQRALTDCVTTDFSRTQQAATQAARAKPAASPDASQAPPTMAATTSALTPTQPATGSHIIAFGSDRAGKLDIFVLDIAQSNAVTDLTKDSSAAVWGPTWSPDGKQIAFSSDCSGASQIYSMNADGSNVRQLTHARDAFHPDWSLDGKQMAYASTVWGQTYSQIFVMNSDGSNPRQLTDTPYYVNYLPKWSPDGQRISFMSQRDHPMDYTGEIYVMNADGTGTHRLLATSMNIESSNWAPDGLKIVFAAKPGAKGVSQIFTVSPQGTDLRRVTQTSSNETAPAYSPDGQYIVFASDRASKEHRVSISDLFMMRADGSGAVQLTDVIYDNRDPAWRPGPY